MEFGVFYQLPCGDGQTVVGRYDDTIAQARLADELGFDAVWLAELHFNRPFSVMSAPLMVGSAIAASTERIKIGTAVNQVPLHHPIRLAEEAATLDVLSHGRAIFGIGRGSNPRQFLGYGVDVEEGRSRFQESVELVIKAWTTDGLSHHGEHYQVDSVSVEPKPQQKPHPPVYVATNSPDTFGLVGSMGYNVLVAPMISTIPGAQAGLADYHQNLSALGPGHGGGRVNVNVPTFVAENRNEAHARFEPSVGNYLSSIRGFSSIARGDRRASRIGQLNYESIATEFGAVGDPEECADRIRHIQELYGAHEIMCWFNIGGMIPSAEVEKSMRLFADRVMPQLG